MSVFDDLPELNRERRGHTFYGADVRKAPALYSTEEVPRDEKTVVAHFFIGSSEWLVMEVDQDAGIAFGWACLGGDTLSAELGYVSLLELENIEINGHVVERDLNWEPKRFGDIITS